MNSMMNSATKVSAIERIWSDHLMCDKEEYYLSTTKSQVTDKVFNLSPITLHWFVRTAEFNKFREFPLRFRKTPLVSLLDSMTQYSSTIHSFY